MCKYVVCSNCLVLLLACNKVNVNALLRTRLFYLQKRNSASIAVPAPMPKYFLFYLKKGSDKLGKTNLDFIACLMLPVKKQVRFPLNPTYIFKVKITIFWKYVHNKIEFWISTIVKSTTDQIDPLSSSASSNYLLRYRQCFERNQRVGPHSKKSSDCWLPFSIYYVHDVGSIPFVELRHIRFMIWLQFSREIKSQLVKYDYLKAKSKFIKVWSMAYFYIETYNKMNDGQPAPWHWHNILVFLCV